LKEEYGRDKVLPLWVADMDFAAPRGILQTMRRRLDHGVLGYTAIPKNYLDSIRKWLQDRHAWETERDWICHSPGVVFSLNSIITAMTAPGDGIVIQSPVYHLFASSIDKNHRRIVYNPLRLSNGRYEMDLEDLTNKIDGSTRLMILCSPHNPVGRVWTEEELTAVARCCRERGVIIVSDEIHCDLVFKGHRHRPLAAISKELQEQAIVLGGPTKTFNLAGLAVSHFITANADLRRIFEERLVEQGAMLPTLFGVLAAEAAYTTGHEWLDRLMEYIDGNLGYLRSFLAGRIPQIGMIESEGTYLVWLDFRRLGLSDGDLRRFLIHSAGLALSPGTLFGPGGEGFQRINIGCPRALLEEALGRLEKATARLSL
jgi:cystathionine beta-lyase